MRGNSFSRRRTEQCALARVAQVDSPVGDSEGTGEGEWSAGDCPSPGDCGREGKEGSGDCERDCERNCEREHERESSCCDGEEDGGVDRLSSTSPRTSSASSSSSSSSVRHSSSESSLPARRAAALAGAVEARQAALPLADEVETRCAEVTARADLAGAEAGAFPICRFLVIARFAWPNAVFGMGTL